MARALRVLLAASVGGAFTLSAWSWHATDSCTKRHANEDELSRALGLPTPTEALELQPVRLVSFLSDPEVEALRETIREARGGRKVGVIERDSAGRPSPNGTWRTAYLHTGGFFAERRPELQAKLLAAVVEADREQRWGLLAGREPGSLNFRTVEAHQYGPGGRLSAAGHYDAGSLVTLDIMLSDPDEGAFVGGELHFPVKGGEDLQPKIGKGDIVMFCSHRHHNVRPVTKGLREVLVAEIWEGPEKTCAHRCVTTGPCEHTLGKSRVNATMANVSMLG